MARARGRRRHDEQDATTGAALVLDAGALIGIEKRSPYVQELVTQARVRLLALVIPTVVVAQVVRRGGQVNLRRFLADPALTFVEMDYRMAVDTGVVLGESGTADVVDGCVVVCARQRGGAPVVTSDPDDLRALDPGIPLIPV